jgi:hypothetical protein
MGSPWDMSDLTPIHTPTPQLPINPLPNVALQVRVQVLVASGQDRDQATRNRKAPRAPAGITTTLPQYIVRTDGQEHLWVYATQLPETHSPHYHPLQNRRLPAGHLISHNMHHVAALGSMRQRNCWRV